MFRIQHVHFKLVFDDLSKAKLADFVQLRRVDGKRPLTPNFPVRVRSEAFPASAPTHPANTLSGAASSPHTSYRPPRGAPAHVYTLDISHWHPSDTGRPIRSLFPISSLLPAGHCAHAQPLLCLLALTVRARHRCARSRHRCRSTPPAQPPQPQFPA